MNVGMGTMTVGAGMTGVRRGLEGGSWSTTSRHLLFLSRTLFDFLVVVAPPSSKQDGCLVCSLPWTPTTPLLQEAARRTSTVTGRRGGGAEGGMRAFRRRGTLEGYEQVTSLDTIPDWDKKRGNSTLSSSISLLSVPQPRSSHPVRSWLFKHFFVC